MYKKVNSAVGSFLVLSLLLFFNACELDKYSESVSSGGSIGIDKSAEAVTIGEPFYLTAHGTNEDSKTDYDIFGNKTHHEKHVSDNSTIESATSSDETIARITFEENIATITGIKPGRVMFVLKGNSWEVDTPLDVVEPQE